ncbi:MAG TPA: flagellar biosynthesis anti-sigma factor FlgM [Anaeromyxobacteraceae bacterium]|nr:flagellar biosynthesis anti-sigma factor FlgM [Anaeromyxobacteraceae bacterium]
MKVDGTSEIRPVDAQKPVDAAKAPASGTPSAQADKVTTQESAQLAQTVAAVRAQVGEGQSARLAAIEAAVRQGTYRPDPARIAEQILQDAEVSARLQAMLAK